MIYRPYEPRYIVGAHYISPLQLLPIERFIVAATEEMCIWVLIKAFFTESEPAPKAVKTMLSTALLNSWMNLLRFMERSFLLRTPMRNSYHFLFCKVGWVHATMDHNAAILCVIHVPL